MNFKELARYFRQMKHYFIASFAVFIVGIWIGYTQVDQFRLLIESQIKGIGQISNTISNTDYPELWFFVFIFLNNAVKSIIVVFSGVFFGFIPIFFLFMNGLLLGYIGAEVVSDNSLFTLVKGILPHGIIEIPTITIAGAFGIRFGFLILKWIVYSPSEQHRSLVNQEIRKFLQMLKPLSVMLIGALLVAAIIESTLTFWLLK